MTPNRKIYLASISKGEDYIRHMIKLCIDLRNKLMKLRSYIGNNANKNIDLLYVQANIMTAYINILELRGKKYGIDLNQKYYDAMEKKK